MWVPGQGLFSPQDFNLNNIGRGPLDEAVCHILKALAFWFQTKRFLKVSLYNMWALGWGHFWSQGYNLNNVGRGLLDETAC